VEELTPIAGVTLVTVMLSRMEDGIKYLVSRNAADMLLAL
jgi:hypothetical protein